MNHFESVDKITSAWDSSWHDNNCVYIMHCISNSKFCTPTASALPFNLSVPGSLSLKVGVLNTMRTLLGDDCRAIIWLYRLLDTTHYSVVFTQSTLNHTLVFMCVGSFSFNTARATHRPPPGQSPTAGDRGNAPFLIRRHR